MRALPFEASTSRSFGQPDPLAFPEQPSDDGPEELPWRAGGCYPGWTLRQHRTG
jgi:hypothetical protein